MQSLALHNGHLHFSITPFALVSSIFFKHGMQTLCLHAETAYPRFESSQKHTGHSKWRPT